MAGKAVPMFQSFYVSGLGKKPTRWVKRSYDLRVSILLCQWIR